MPIEFQCTNCQRKLRVPDESGGQKAKCPQCQSVQTIPASQDTSSGDGENLLDWGGLDSDTGASAPASGGGYGASSGGYGASSGGYGASSGGYGQTPGGGYGSAPNPYASQGHNPYTTPGVSSGSSGYRSSANQQPSPVAIISLICGIASFVGMLCCGFFAVPISLAAVVCGVIGILQSKGKSPAGLGISIAGTVCGVLSGFLSVAFIIFVVAVELSK